jgi:hypothetical protein
MVTTEIIEAILSKDKDRLSEAKTAIKEMLSIKAESFKEGAKKFVAKSIFEGSESDMGSTMIPHKIPDTAPQKGFDQTPGAEMGKDKTGHVYDPSAPVTDAMTGVVGTVEVDPTNSGHPITPPDSFTASSGKIDNNDAFKSNVAPEDGIDTTIAILTGLEKGV